MDGRFKLVFLVAILLLTSLPVIGLLKGSDPPSTDHERSPALVRSPQDSTVLPQVDQDRTKKAMVFIPAGEFIQGTDQGGYNEGPEQNVFVKSFWIDRFEITNDQYQAFVKETRHRQPGPPSRYAKNMVLLRGMNQPVTYVSWDDAQAFCHWTGGRLPTEVEWEKAIRGIDGRLWPWGNYLEVRAANFGGAGDTFEVTAPVGSFFKDRSVFDVYDGAGNLMEWVADWYEERRDVGHTSIQQENRAADYGSYKVLRGLGYTSRGSDLRITNRSFIIPTFRDETIGFRCASSKKPSLQELLVGQAETQSS